MPRHQNHVYLGDHRISHFEEGDGLASRDDSGHPARAAYPARLGPLLSSLLCTSVSLSLSLSLYSQAESQSVPAPKPEHRRGRSSRQMDILPE
ncbi:hypothetical protein PGTUg99_021098 [Puccinia graminis f. sp. tritici]|uniref:Uncharacterized protein n=1 Tax=Puccinia graminis f. sp. tritici TaxID=56615 RepID=A0A5B0PIE2_PUCGR|nr:hypothetical protein PGTUg99_021098 [Puccinia graminis f. sp. tritici]